MSDAVSADAEASIIVRERLRILSVGFYVRGGMMALFGCFFLLYAGLLAGMSFIPESGWDHTPPASASVPSAEASPTAPARHSHPSPPPLLFFRIMAGLFCLAVLFVWVLAALTAYAGRCIQKRRAKMFVYVMAGFNCLFVPYGTLLGVFTFIVLGSPPASREFRLTTAG